MIDAPSGVRVGAYAPPPSPVKRFSPRQRELIDLLVAKGSVVAAAREMNITVHTARAHVREIANKLQNPRGLPAVKLILSQFDELR